MTYKLNNIPGTLVMRISVRKCDMKCKECNGDAVFYYTTISYLFFLCTGLLSFWYF